MKKLAFLGALTLSAHLMAAGKIFVSLSDSATPTTSSKKEALSQCGKNYEECRLLFSKAISMNESAGFMSPGGYGAINVVYGESNDGSESDVFIGTSAGATPQKDAQNRALRLCERQLPNCRVVSKKVLETAGGYVGAAVVYGTDRKERIILD